MSWPVAHLWGGAMTFAEAVEVFAPLREMLAVMARPGAGAPR